jgi:hypothetical protein
MRHHHRQQGKSLAHDRGQLEAVGAGEQVDIGDDGVDVLGANTASAASALAASITLAPASCRSTRPV